MVRPFCNNVIDESLAPNFGAGCGLVLCTLLNETGAIQ